MKPKAWMQWPKPWPLAVALFVLATGPWLWPVREVVVVGHLPYLHSPSIKTALLGRLQWGMWWSSLSQSRAALRKYPWVADAKIRRIYPDQWEVVLMPPPIVARWHQGGVINDVGEVIVLKNMPEGFGQKPLWRTSPDFLPHLATLMRDLTPAMGNFPFQLEQVSFSPLSGPKLVFSEGVVVRLPLNQKAPKLFARFINRMPSLGGARALQGKTIDLRYKHGFSLH